MMTHQPQHAAQLQSIDVGYDIDEFNKVGFGYGQHRDLMINWIQGKTFNGKDCPDQKSFKCSPSLVEELSLLPKDAWVIYCDYRDDYNLGGLDLLDIFEPSEEEKHLVVFPKRGAGPRMYFIAWHGSGNLLIEAVWQRWWKRIGCRL